MYKPNISDRDNNIIDGLIDEYKDMLIDYTIRNNNDFYIRELIELDLEAKNILRKKKSDKRKMKIYNMMMSIGILYTMLGVMTYILLNYESMIRKGSISVVISLLGILIVISVYMLKTLESIIPINKYMKNNLKTNKVENLYYNKYKLVDKWIEIENLSNLILINKNSNSNIMHMPIQRQIKLLEEEGYLGISDIEKIRTVLALRNKIVHGKDEKIDIINIKTEMNYADEIINKLKKEL